MKTKKFSSLSPTGINQAVCFSKNMIMTYAYHTICRGRKRLYGETVMDGWYAIQHQYPSTKQPINEI